MDRFDALTAFVAVVEHNGFAPAARKLGLSPSAATRFVAALEEHLGVRLLNRTTRSVSLTDAGARFLVRARQLLFDLDEAEKSAENERGAPSGRLILTAPLVFGRLHVAPLLCAYMRAHPQVQSELILTDRMVNLVDEGLDLALRIGALPDTADVARKLGMTRRVLVASPAYLAQAGMPQKPADLSHHRLISFTALTNARNWRFTHAGIVTDITVSPSYTTNSADAAIWHAQQGGGITMALSYQVIDLIRKGDLRIVLEAFEPEPLPIQFVYASSRLVSTKVRALIDMAAATQQWSFLDLS